MQAIGKVMVTPKGNYNPTDTYEPLDIVRYNRSSWISLSTQQGTTPVDDGINWRLLNEDGNGGDMYMINYDSNGDHIVDAADKVGNADTAVLEKLSEAGNELQFDGKEIVKVDGTTITKSNGLLKLVDAIKNKIDNRAARNQIGLEWDSSTLYAKGRYCVYGDSIYRALGQNQGIAPDDAAQGSSYWILVRVIGELATANSNIDTINTSKIDADRIAPAWDENTSYTVGRYVRVGDLLYRCIKDAKGNQQSPSYTTYWTGIRALGDLVGLHDFIADIEKGIRTTKASATATTAGQQVLIPVATVANNTIDADTSEIASKGFKITKTGWYQLVFNGAISVTSAGNVVTMGIFNGNTALMRDTKLLNASTAYFNLSGQFYIEAGAYINLKVYTSAVASVTAETILDCRLIKYV